eukprot:9486503-Pyramimonas_sp.AAC.2
MYRNPSCCNKRSSLTVLNSLSPMMQVPFLMDSFAIILVRKWRRKHPPSPYPLNSGRGTPLPPRGPGCRRHGSSAV